MKTSKQIRKGVIQKKVLLLLLAGVTLGLTRSPKRYFQIVKSIHKEWKEIDRRALTQAIRNLYASRLVKTKSNKDGTLTLVL